MNDDLMLEYLLGVGQMQPEQQKLARSQSYVDALRQGGMTSPQGQMAGRVYVAPSLTQYAAQMGNAYMGRKGQEGLDVKYNDANAKQAAMIDALRKRMDARRAGLPQPTPPQTTMGMSGKAVRPEDELLGPVY